jgi:hypothetical protein
MSQIASIPVLDSTAACLQARTGAFVLAAAQALTLHPKTAATIRITCGHAWVTLGDGCDYFLIAEQTLHAPPGSRVVMESMRKDGMLKFDWQPDREASQQDHRLQEGSLQERSPQENSLLAQALLDLRGAAVLAARGFAGLATALVAGLARGFGAVLAEVLTGGLAARARSAHSSARAAQGRMASCESMASSGAV